MRHTKSHTANRRSHHKVDGGSLVKCEKCNKLKQNHTVCGNCGTYKGRVVLKTEGKLENSLKKSGKKTETK